MKKKCSREVISIKSEQCVPCIALYLVSISGRFFSNSKIVLEIDDVFGSSKTFLGILKIDSPSSRSSRAIIPNL